MQIKQERKIPKSTQGFPIHLKKFLIPVIPSIKAEIKINKYTTLSGAYQTVIAIDINNNSVRTLWYHFILPNTADIYENERLRGKLPNLNIVINNHRTYSRTPIYSKIDKLLINSD